MLTRFYDWLVFEDPDMPTDLLLSRLDLLDGIHNRTEAAL